MFARLVLSGRGYLLTSSQKILATVLSNDLSDSLNLVPFRSIACLVLLPVQGPVAASFSLSCPLPGLALPWQNLVVALCSTRRINVVARMIIC